MGKDCGYHYAADYHDCYGTAHVEYRKGCEKCCANADQCWPYDHVLGYWYHQWGPGYDDQWTEYPDTCQPWPVPTWSDCVQNCQSAKCHMMSRKHGYSQYSPGGGNPCPCERGYWEDTVCDGYGDDMEASPGCGYHRNEKGCRSWDWQQQRCVDDPHAGYNCLRRVEGYSYYACTPGQCNHGWDANHGGQFKKNRLDHVWHPGLYSKATGPPGNEFSGNCLGDMFGCGETYPMGPDSGLWFHEVTGIYWRGLVPSWYAGCDGMRGCSPDCSFGNTLALPPAVPGYGYHGAYGPLCAQYVDSQSGCFSAWAGTACCTGHICQCSLGDFPVCKGEAAWVAVDLNLDGSGRPYRYFPGRNGGLPPYEGRGVPADRLDALIPMFDLRFDEQERRVVFPVREGGRELGYTARAIDARERKRWLSYPVEGGHKTTIYDADRVRAGGNTLFVVEGPFDALMVTAAIQPDNDSVATAFFGSLPTEAQLALIVAAVPFYRMVYMMLDANVWGRCRRLAREVAKLAGVPNVGAINIGFENRDPGETRPAWQAGVIHAEGHGEWYWIAPAKFLGNLSAAYGQRLSIEWSTSTSCRDSGDYRGFVVLTGGGVAIAWGDRPRQPNVPWTTYSVVLDETATWYVAGTNLRASDAQIQAVLSNLEKLEIFGQNENCRGTTQLRRVSIALWE